MSWEYTVKISDRNSKYFGSYNEFPRAPRSPTFNKSRIAKAENATAMSSKEARKSRRADKVAENDAYEEDEGILYAPGIDDWRKYKFTYENLLLNFKRVFLKTLFFWSARVLTFFLLNRLLSNFNRLFYTLIVLVGTNENFFHP